MYEYLYIDFFSIGGSSNAEKPHALLRLERTLAHELVE
jgi:hypothetical protein